jgi:predicted P-loop ATPase
VADAALASLDSLLAEWLPGGRREGHEYKATNPTRADSRIGSFSINVNTGAWADFATDDKGGDAISLYAYLQGIEQLAAAKYLADKLGIQGADGAATRGGTRTDAPPKTPAGGESDASPGAPKLHVAARTEWEPIVPAPANATELPKAHVARRFPETVWTYRGRAGELLGAVYRFKTSDGGKEVLPCVWARNRRTGAEDWRFLAFPEPRPLYGLECLGTGTVLVVEGEKCADAARAVLPKSWAVVTWPGGARAVGKADWSPLRGRKVVIWPDCDAQQDKGGQVLPEAKQPGVRAAEEVAAALVKLQCQVRIVKIPAPGAKPAGWDVADAIAEGWSGAQVREFIVGNLRPSTAVDAETRSTQGPAAPDEEWKGDLARDNRGNLIAGVPNAFLMLTNRPEWRDVLAFDEFAQRPVKRMPPPFPRGAAGDWEGMDDSRTAFWLATRAGMPYMSSSMAAEAAEMAAREAPYDPVRGYLEEVAWDQTKRVDHWLIDYFGAPDTPYTRLVGRLWLVGMVKRAFEPGCKFDYMPILEGPQGKGKSTALEVLAGKEHFGNTDFVMGDKDSMAVMQGKWIYEIAELDSFNKADSTRVKSFVSRQQDEFRPAYGRRILKIPRRVVLVGTTNQYEYFKDSSGNRRFWPIKCIEQIDVDALREVRAQLLAEAVVLYRAGARCYPTHEEQDAYITAEQDAREVGDTWDEQIYRYLNNSTGIELPPDRVSSLDILVKGLHIEVGKITKEMSTRVGISMRRLGWNKRERRGEHPRYVYERPQKSAHDTELPQAESGGGVPF